MEQRVGFFKGKKSRLSLSRFWNVQVVYHNRLLV
jgi:hypothetical protein